MNIISKLKENFLSVLVSGLAAFVLVLMLLQHWTLMALLAAIILFIVCVEVLLSIPNLKAPLKIKTPDGHDQPFHPSVYYFENGWRGYRYWMALTPYPAKAEPYRDRWESPCIVASQDGLQWEYPGQMEYLDDLSPEQIASKKYYSDTHLLYDAERDCLICYYRYMSGTEDHPCPVLFCKSTQDGIHWSERIELVCCERMHKLSPLSPAISKKRDKFQMWFVSFEEDPEQVYLATSADGINWELQERCILAGNEKVKPWHIDCQFIDGKYYLTVYDLGQTITLWESNDGVHFSYVNNLLNVPKVCKCGCFYANTLYRACLCKTDTGYSLYFSASDSRKFSVGLMRGKNLDNLRVVPGEKNPRIKEVICDIVRKYTLCIRVGVRLLRQMTKK